VSGRGPVRGALDPRLGRSHLLQWPFRVYIGSFPCSLGMSNRIPRASGVSGGSGTSRCILDYWRVRGKEKIDASSFFYLSYSQFELTRTRVNLSPHNSSVADTIQM
jgi:hypothetical protein